MPKRLDFIPGVCSLIGASASCSSYQHPRRGCGSVEAGGSVAEKPTGVKRVVCANTVFTICE
jgi:hypothetical protein